MRSVDSALLAHIEAGASTLCWIWKLVRADGQVLGFTDHDADITLDGVLYSAGSGASGGDSDSALGFAIDNGHIQSVFDDPRISADDINAGLYDRALLLSSVINWQDLSQTLPFTRGYLGEITQKGDSFSAEWIGEGALLSRSQGRVFSRMCDASFGDTRCGINVANYPQGTICPRSFRACRDRFSNLINFRGFPYLLGDDALTASPQAGDEFDGGSRYPELKDG